MQYSNRKALNTAILMALSSIATLGIAQAQQSQQLDKIEVTGSRIKRIDSESAAPVQVITRKDIERSGATTVAEVLRNLPASNTGSFNEAGVASFSPGAASVSLRGLGGAATLVLINGRRVSPFGFASGGQTTFVDLNGIPLEAVERIEILLDGASAIYGSEAMAGVINIIMRRDFNGVSATASYGTSSASDANSLNVGATFGTGSIVANGYNIFGALNFRTQDVVLGNSRAATVNSDYRRFGSIDRRSTYSFPGNAYNVANTSFIGALPGCKTLGTAADGGLNGRCLYEFADKIALIPDSDRISGFMGGVFRINSTSELYGDLSFTANKFQQGSAAYNVATYGYPVVILKANHPQNTFGTDVGIRYRLEDVPLSTDVDSKTLRGVLGYKATFGAWDVDAGLMHSLSDAKVLYKGFTRDPVLENDFLVTGSNVVRNDVTLGALSSELKAKLYPELSNSGKTSTTSVDVRASREVMTLPGGAMGVAFGLDARRESFKSVPDQLIEAGEIGALGTSSADGNRTVTAGFVEVVAPLFPGFEAQVAGRFDRYSDFGSKFTPKIGLKWKAHSSVAIRGSYAEGFRAPALTETSSSPSRGFYSGLRDPKLCPTFSDDNPNCNLNSIPGVSGSNPDLKPETSKGLTLGVILEPVKDLSLAIDYYNIKRKNEISSLDTEYLLSNESLYPGYVTRDVNGVVTGLNLPYENLGSTNVKGWDFDIKGSVSFGEFGRLGLGVTHNLLPTYLVRPVVDAEELNYAGTYQQPKTRTRVTADWEYGNWTFGVTYSHTAGYLRAFTPSDLSCALPAAAVAYGLCNVTPWSTVDVGVRYKPTSKLDIFLNIANIEDKQAPLDQRRETRFTWYSPGFHNVLGRYARLGVKYTF
jgi:iron complex outermembrane recepter protein